LLQLSHEVYDVDMGNGETPDLAAHESVFREIFRGTTDKGVSQRITPRV
jgi:hypothetical protein